MTTTVNRDDITLEEIATYHGTLGSGFSEVHSSIWSASFSGRLSTGELATIPERSASTSAKALANLEAAIEENGWSIK